MLRLFSFLVVGAVVTGCSDASAPATVPNAPDRVFASARLNAIELTWTDASSNEETFQVDVSVDEGPFLLLGIFPRNTTIAEFPDPQPAHTYRFRVSACNRAGCSEVREASVNTNAWLKPVIANITAATTGPAGVVVTLRATHFARPVDVRVFLIRAGVPGAPIERFETVNPDPRNPESQFLKQYFFSGLQQGAEYIYQATLTNPFGITTSGPQRLLVDFTAPEIIAVTIATLTSTSVQFLVSVRPGGLQTLIRPSFVPEYRPELSNTGTTIEGAADGTLRQAIVTRFALEPNTAYKARLTATNAAGSTNSAEIRFTTLP